MYRGTTPTLTLTLPEGTDFTDTNVYVTLSDENKRNALTITEDGLEIADNVISVWLSQEQTLNLPRRVLVQVNWTYGDGQRACSNIVSFNTSRNLIDEVL